MPHKRPHISVCICTYKRPESLEHLLHELGNQDTGGLFTYSIVIAENDHLRSAEPVAKDFADFSPIPVRYCVEPQQNIALARNKTIANASGTLVAFIDDDEFPTSQWLLALFKTLEEYQADGVLGPVKPHFDDKTPRWVIEGGFYDRLTHRTGLALQWNQCRTGNVLLKRELFQEDAQPFNPEFLSGEDHDFFRRMTGRGHVFVWCNEAVAYETIPPARWRRGFLMRRALFRGVFSQHNRRSSILPILRSLVAVPAYLIALPVTLFLGQAKFMRFLFNMSYHVGRLLSVAAINSIKHPYPTS